MLILALLVGFSFANELLSVSLPEPGPNERALIDSLQSCMLGQAESPIRNKPRQAYSVTHKPGGSYMLLYDLVDAHDVLMIRNLAKCMQIVEPESMQRREFREAAAEVYIKGNKCTFLSSFMPRVLPELVNHLLRAAHSTAQAAGWSPSPFELGLRTLEFIEYEKGESLAMHQDADSVYTLLLVLSNPKTDFTGGYFFIEPNLGQDGEVSIPLRPPQFTGILFNSETLHGLNELQSGHREIFAMELWDYPHVIGGARPSPPENSTHIPVRLRVVRQDKPDL